MSLLNTRTGYTTPWHCSVALLADGEWISAPMGDFQKDPRFEVVHENGRPSYFVETTAQSGSTPTVEQEQWEPGPAPPSVVQSVSTTATKPSPKKTKLSKRNIDSEHYQDHRQRGKGATFILTGFFLNLVVALLASILFSSLTSTTSTFKGRGRWILAVFLLAAFSSALEARVVRRLSIV